MNSKGALKSRSFVALLSALMLALTISVLAAAAFAQAGPTGTLSGAVHDPTGASVSGAKITAINAETGLSRNATADAEG